MSIKTQIEKAIARVFSSGKADEFIQEAAERSIKDVIQNSFRAYGTVGKQIEEQIGSALELRLNGFDLAGYNHTVAGMVEKLLLEHLETEAARTISERLEQYLSPAPAQITVQEIVDRFKEEWKEESSELLEPEIQITQSDWSTESTTIKLWREGRYTTTITKRENTPELDIYIYKGKITIPRMKTTVFASRIAFQLESYIYTLAVRGTEITDAHTVDEDDIDVDMGYDF